MRLGNLCPGLVGPDAELNVTGFAIDHRKIAPGTIFGAFKGAQFNAEDFIGEAVANGAVAIVASTAADVCGAVGDTAGRLHDDVRSLLAASRPRVLTRSSSQVRATTSLFARKSTCLACSPPTARKQT